MRVRELVVRYRALEGAGQIDPSLRLATPRDAATFLVPLLAEEATEVLGILCLTAKQAVVAWHEVSRGTLDSTNVHPREVFKAAILANAASIVLAHVHPSGDPTPSPDDLAITARLVSAGTVLGIEIADHVIVGHDGRYYSFREGGRL